MSRNIRYALIILGLILVWLFSGFLAGDDADTEEVSSESSLAKVEVMKSDAQPYHPSLIFNARTEPFRLVNLRAETEGPLIEVNVAEGEEVAESVLIAKIDPESRPLRVQESRSLLRQAQLEYEGAMELKAKGLLSDAEVARNKFSVDSAQAALEAAEIELSRSVINAPFDGILNERFYEVGDYLQKGQIFAEFLQLDPLKAVFHVSNSEVMELDPERALTLTLADGRELTGEFLFRSSKADPQSRAFKVEATFDNPENRILADLTGRISVWLKAVNAHSVPASVLSLDTSGQLAVKAIDSEQQVLSYPVSIVEDDSESVWVTGLPDQVYVIVTGYEYVGVGDHVNAVYRQVAEPVPASDAAAL